MDTEVLQQIYEQLQQINDNIVHVVCVFAALVGMIIGFWAAKELLRIWQ